MDDFNRYFDVEDMFCNLFVLAGECEIKPDVFTRSIEKHNFIKCIEKGDYRHAYDESLLDVFNDSLSYCLNSNDYENEWNEYYWVGKCYFYIQSETHKSFSYIFMKFPFEELLPLFYPYHETDISHIYEIFLEKEKEKTILEILCKRRKLSIAKLSSIVNIPISTLTKYRKSDEYLYKASFENIYLLSQFFDCPETLFLQKIPQIE